MTSERPIHHADLAAQWNCSVKTVLRHIHSGALPAIEMGPRTFLITPVDAAVFYSSRKVAPNLSASGVSSSRGRPWGS
jgi:hypothetical protein